MTEVILKHEGTVDKFVGDEVMAIFGGAILPAIMGRISDATNIRTAFIVPLLCYLYIFYFAVNGYKPGNARSKDAPSMARMGQQS